MARYIDADELIRLIEIDALCEGDYFSKRAAIKCVKTINTADVVPKSEVEGLITLNSQLEAVVFGQRKEIESLEKALRNSLPSYCQVITEEKAISLGKEYGRREVARDILSDLKKQIHDKAVRPHNAGIDAYISLKVFDAILQNYLNNLK